MATNLTDEIRALVEAAAQRVSDAEAQAASCVVRARDEAAKKVKESRQSLYREYRNKVEKLEKEAADQAAGLVDQGKKKAAEFVKAHEGLLAKTSKWVAEEVMSRYGRS